MPMFLCPCCAESYLVPLAFCEYILEERHRSGWNGFVAPARCVGCQKPIGVGDSVIVRPGAVLTQDGEEKVLPVGSKASVLEVSTWEGEGSIFLLGLPDGQQVLVTRAQIKPA